MSIGSKNLNKKFAQNAQTQTVCLKSMQKDGQKDLPVYYVSNINKNFFKLHEKEKTTLLNNYFRKI